MISLLVITDRAKILSRLVAQTYEIPRLGDEVESCMCK